ncbi:MAG TPA: hypothetical protein VFW96_04775 [Thermomicrobiales bacterium]|nr:hypothetical protein [Thermomicrobiales bacterium]
MRLYVLIFCTGLVLLALIVAIDVLARSTEGARLLLLLAGRGSPAPASQQVGGATVPAAPPLSQTTVALAIGIPLFVLGGGAALLVTRFAAWYARRWKGPEER